MKPVLFLLTFIFLCLKTDAQPFLEFLQKEINMDTVPLRIINGHAQMVLNVQFRNVGNEPLVVQELSTVVTDYSMQREYKYLPSKPIQPQQIDSIVVIILPELDGNPLYYYNPTVWEFQIYSNSTPNYFNSMKCIWNSCKSDIIRLSDMGPKHDQLLEGENYEFKYFLLPKGDIPIVVDSIEFAVKQRSNYKRIIYDAGLPVMKTKNDSLYISATINTSGQYGEQRCESFIHYHYPNFQTAVYNTSNVYKVLPNFKVLDSSIKYFGVINQGETVVADFSIMNYGTYPLYFRNSDCVSFSKDIINPGEMVAIRINYNSKFDTGKVHKSYRIWLGRSKKDTCCKWESNLTYYDVAVNGIIIPHLVNSKYDFIQLSDTVHELRIENWKKIQKRNQFPDEYIIIEDSIEFQNTSSYEIGSLDVQHPGKKVIAGWSDKRKAMPNEKGKIYFQTLINKGEYEFNDIFYVTFEIQYDCQSKRFEIPVKIHGVIQK